jgi:hypothetical protein
LHGRIRGDLLSLFPRGFGLTPNLSDLTRAKHERNASTRRVSISLNPTGILEFFRLCLSNFSLQNSDGVFLGVSNWAEKRHAETWPTHFRKTRLDWLRGVSRQTWASTRNHMHRPVRHRTPSVRCGRAQ